MRLLRGEIGMRLFLWSEGSKRHLRVVREAREVARIQDDMHKRGLHKLRLVFSRLTRGEVGMRMYLWAGRVKDAAQERNIAKIQAALAKQQSRGLTKLKIAFAKIARGETAMRIAVWYSGWEDYRGYTEERARAMEITARIRSQAVSKLRISLARMTRGEVGMRIMLWRSTSQRAHMLGQVPSLKQELISLKQSIQERDRRVEAAMGEVTLLGRAVNANREDLEVRLEKQWAGVGQAMDMLGTALNLREPLLHHLHQRDRRSPGGANRAAEAAGSPPATSSTPRGGTNLGPTNQQDRPGLDRFGRF